MESSFQKIYQVVSRIPCGRTATYGQVAALAGNPRWARVVGYALHAAPAGLPCHRVVNREGRTADAFRAGGQDWQRIFLEEEGVPFLADGRVDLARCQWDGGEAPENGNTK